jgi:hypothetical protein
MEATQATRSEQRRLGERIADLRRRGLDVRAVATAHPWELVGAAALLGAWLALVPSRPRTRAPNRGRLGQLVASVLGALAIRIAREAALRGAGQIARRWWDADPRPHPPT